MAAKTDLTFAELNTALGGNAITYDADADDQLISVKAITGDTYTGLNVNGVSELILKALKACYTAQTAANEDLDEDEQLRSFPAPTYAGLNVAAGSMQVTYTSRFELNIDPNNVTGVNS